MGIKLIHCHECKYFKRLGRLSKPAGEGYDGWCVNHMPMIEVEAEHFCVFGVKKEAGL